MTFQSDLLVPDIRNSNIRTSCYSWHWIRRHRESGSSSRRCVPVSHPPTDDLRQRLALLDDEGVPEGAATQPDVGARERRLHVVVVAARTPVVIDAVVEGQAVNVPSDGGVVGLAQSGELRLHEPQRVGEYSAVEQLQRGGDDTRRHMAAPEVPVHDRFLQPRGDEPQREDDHGREPAQVGDDGVDEFTLGREWKPLDGGEEEHALGDAAGREEVEKTEDHIAAYGVADEDKGSVRGHVLVNEVLLVLDLTVQTRQVLRVFCKQTAIGFVWHNRRIMNDTTTLQLDCIVVLCECLPREFPIWDH